MDYFLIVVVLGKGLWYYVKMIDKSVYLNSEQQYIYTLPEVVWKAYQALSFSAPCLVTDIGYFPQARCHMRQRPEGSEQYILLFCAKGQGYYCLDEGERRPLKAGQMVILQPLQPHQYGADDAAPWSLYWVHFDTAIPCNMQWLSGLQAVICPEEDDLAQITGLFQRCFRLLEKPHQKQSYFAICQYIVTVLAMMQLYIRQTEIPLTPKGDKALRKAVAFMEANIRKTLKLSDIAKAANFSSSHIIALFKNNTSYPPMDYFLRMKMQAAAKTLYFSECSIKEIAVEYGIQDPYYFSRLFKRYMGVSPVQYRKLDKG